MEFLIFGEKGEEDMWGDNNCVNTGGTPSALTELIHIIVKCCTISIQRVDLTLNE